jgi:hypothetical protein
VDVAVGNVSIAVGARRSGRGDACNHDRVGGPERSGPR